MEKLPPSSRPTTFDLSQNYVGNKGLPVVIDIVSVWQTLKSLNLSNNFLESNTIALLCGALKRHPSVTSLNLSGNQLYDTSARLLLDLIKMNRKIVDLNLDGADFKPSVTCKIAKQIMRNLEHRQAVFHASISDHFNLAISTVLPADPSPFATWFPLRPALRASLMELYEAEKTNSLDGGAPLSDQRRLILSMIEQFDWLPIEMISDLGIEMGLKIVENFGFWSNGPLAMKTALTQLQNRFDSTLRTDRLLADQVLKLHECIEQSKPADIQFLWPIIQMKLVVTSPFSHSAEQAKSILQSYLLKKFESKCLSLLATKIGYLEFEGLQIPPPIEYRPNLLHSNYSLIMEWDWQQLLTAFQFHYECFATVNLAALTDRWGILEEVTELFPPSLLEFVCIQCFIYNNPSLPLLFHQIPTLLPKPPSNTSSSLNCTSVSLRGSTFSASHRPRKDFLTLLASWLASTETIEQLCLQWCQWISLQDPDYVTASLEKLHNFLQTQKVSSVSDKRK